MSFHSLAADDFNALETQSGVSSADGEQQEKKRDIGALMLSTEEKRERERESKRERAREQESERKRERERERER